MLVHLFEALFAGGLGVPREAPFSGELFDAITRRRRQPVANNSGIDPLRFSGDGLRHLRPAPPRPEHCFTEVVRFSGID